MAIQDKLNYFQPWFFALRKKGFQSWTALKKRCSEIFCPELAMNSSARLWISSEQPWIPGRLQHEKLSSCRSTTSNFLISLVCCVRSQKRFAFINEVYSILIFPLIMHKWKNIHSSCCINVHRQIVYTQRQNATSQHVLTRHLSSRIWKNIWNHDRRYNWHFQSCTPAINQEFNWKIQNEASSVTVSHTRKIDTSIMFYQVTPFFLPNSWEVCTINNSKLNKYLYDVCLKKLICQSCHFRGCHFAAKCLRDLHSKQSKNEAVFDLLHWMTNRSVNSKNASFEQDRKLGTSRLSERILTFSGNA